MTLFFEEILNCKVFSIKSVAGGDINKAYKLETAKGTFFAKINDSKYASEILLTESKALNLLMCVGGIKVPEAINVNDHKNYTALILEWIETGKANKNTSNDLAIRLSTLHNVNSPNFGLDYDNFIGSLTQINTKKDNWLDFYYQYRITPQLKQAVESGNVPSNYIQKTDTVFKNMENEMPTVSPSLIHGDLWGGNYMIDKKGQVIFIDPAISFSHREMDIAMMMLFGGFDPEVFDIYNKLSPLDPGWRNRMNFYQLYYILVHVNLFGGSYSNSAKNIIDSYL